MKKLIIINQHFVLGARYIYQGAEKIQGVCGIRELPELVRDLDIKYEVKQVEVVGTPIDPNIIQEITDYCYQKDINYVLDYDK